MSDQTKRILLGVLLIAAGVFFLLQQVLDIAPLKIIQGQSARLGRGRPLGWR